MLVRRSAWAGCPSSAGQLHEVISGRKVEWVLEADLKNFFGSLSHEWMLRFVEHRVGDPLYLDDVAVSVQ